MDTPNNPTLGKPSPKTAARRSRRRLLVVDDHPMTRAGLVQLIDKQPDLEVCGEAGNPAEAFHEFARSRPDLVLADLTMPGRSGIEFIRDLLVLQPDLPILVVSMHDEMIFAERALRAGVRGYIMKEAGGENLLAAIRQVLDGQLYLSPKLSVNLLNHLFSRKPRGSDSPIRTLSDREFEIFQLIGQGKRAHEIAQQLHLSPKTVDVHRGHIREKLALSDTSALISYAARWVETEGARL